MPEQVVIRALVEGIPLDPVGMVFASLETGFHDVHLIAQPEHLVAQLVAVCMQQLEVLIESRTQVGCQDSLTDRSKTQEIQRRNRGYLPAGGNVNLMAYPAG
jgi:hypothetical protein